MTDDLIQRLAREAGFAVYPPSMHSLSLIYPPMYEIDGGSDMTEELRRFAALVAREALTGVEEYLEAAAVSSMSRNNSENLAAELLAQIKEPTNG